MSRDNVRATQAGLNKKMTDAEMRELLKPPPLIPLSRADIQKKARIMMLQRSAHAEAEQRWMDDYVGRGVFVNRLRESRVVPRRWLLLLVPKKGNGGKRASND